MQLVKGDLTSAGPSAFATGGVDWNSCLPEGSRAVIRKPAKSAMTSGRARTKRWCLRIERQCAPWIEPLMGWTADDDVAQQIELGFPDLEAAIRHARRLGLPYEVQMPPGTDLRRGSPVLVATSPGVAAPCGDADLSRQAA